MCILIDCFSPLSLSNTNLHYALLDCFSPLSLSNINLHYLLSRLESYLKGGGAFLQVSKKCLGFFLLLPLFVAIVQINFDMHLSTNVLYIYSPIQLRFIAINMRSTNNRENCNLCELFALAREQGKLLAQYFKFLRRVLYNLAIIWGFKNDFSLWDHTYNSLKSAQTLLNQNLLLFNIFSILNKYTWLLWWTAES